MSAKHENAGSNPVRRSFRGRRVVLDGKYPGVYWPEHPMSRAHGMAHVHRIVAYERYGDLPDGLEVHHDDEDVWNWDEDNLHLMSKPEHAREHTRRGNGFGYGIEKVPVSCPQCGREFEVYPARLDRTEEPHCSTECSSKSQLKIEWPSLEELERLVETKGYVGTGRLLGVSDNAVRKAIQRL